MGIPKRKKAKRGYPKHVGIQFRHENARHTPLYSIEESPIKGICLVVWADLKTGERQTAEYSHSTVKQYLKEGVWVKQDKEKENG
ncbi:MAG: hypothetical protein KUG81_02450 [Gammaproteobacteria bacterium]|nr:hypothetical protein [Gammaproteobacteria bacterium]